jgi:fucose permease
MDTSTRKGQGWLFATAFAAITATSFCFILRALVIDNWGVDFALTETQKGELLGVGLWPFSITIVLMSLFIDRIGFRVTLWFAALCHIIGLGLLFTATGYWSLYAGTFIMALGNGAVEAAANPLIATLFAHDKSKWLNRLHAAWPGGMILGGLLAMGLDSLGGFDWRVKVGLMIIPVLVYTVLLIGRKFPVSERVASGVSYRTMLGEAGFISAFILAALIMLEVGRVFALSPVMSFGVAAVLALVYAFFARSPGRPLFILLVLVMMPLAVTELSTDSWISSLMTPEMNKLGLAAGWVLIYTSALVFVIRIFAGTLIKWLNPLGVLAMASALAAAGLFLMSGATGLAILAAATFYGIGKSFFWGTALGVASEQFPKGGAVTLNMLAGGGMLAAGIVGSVLLGAAQDNSTQRGLKLHDATHQTTLSEQYLTEKVSVFGRYKALDEAKVAVAPDADKAVVEGLSGSAKKDALKEVALLPVITCLIFLGLILWFRRRGGYKPVVIGETH